MKKQVFVSVCVGMLACPVAVTPRLKIPLPRWRLHAGGSVVYACVYCTYVSCPFWGCMKARTTPYFECFSVRGCMCGYITALILYFRYPVRFCYCLPETGR